jgi:hypothetical protein
MLSTAMVCNVPDLCELYHQEGDLRQTDQRATPNHEEDRKQMYKKTERLKKGGYMKKQGCDILYTRTTGSHHPTLMMNACWLWYQFRVRK